MQAKRRTGNGDGKSASRKKREGETYIQFAAPDAMVKSIDRLLDKARESGICMTRSHVVRCAVAKYLQRIGYIEKPDVDLSAM